MRINIKLKHIIIVAVLFIVIITLLITLFLPSNKIITTGVNVVVVPSDSEILLDSKKISSGETSATSGKHTIEVRHNHFNTQKTQIEVINNQVLFVPVGLSPNDSTGESWKKDNLNAYSLLESIGSNKYVQQSQNMSNKYPIILGLPYDMSPLFRIDYGISKKYPGDTLKIAIYISSDNPTDQLTAINKIYEMGYDPSDYEIIFKDIK